MGTCYNVLNEFKDVKFKDKRLNNRFSKIIKTLEKSPSGLISKAFVDAKDQKGAYRFFQNKDTDYKKMLQFHQLRVSDRCQKHKIILAIQDSTSLSLPGAKKVKSVGHIGDLSRQYPGLNIHTSLLISPQKEVLGISDLNVYNRKLCEKTSSVRRREPVLQKETNKWLQAITNTKKQIDTDAKLVWIADREGDFWDYFSKLEETDELFVQRVVHKRPLEDNKENYFSYLQKQRVLGEYSFEIPSKGGNHGRKNRKVVCEVRTAKLKLKKPREHPSKMNNLEVQGIYVTEKESKNPLEWFLITNIECNTFEEIREKIRWYELRWTIEELHRVVKSGCGVEEMRLEHADRMMKYLLLLFILGARILSMTKLAKNPEEIPCTEVFSEEEWKFLFIRKYKKLPEKNIVPNLKEAVRLLAILGGFYEYNTKRTPGTMTIWRGLHRLKESLDTLEVMKKTNHSL